MESLIGRKYHLNPETLKFELVKLTPRLKVRYSLLIGTGLILLAVLFRIGFEKHYPTPRLVMYERENEQLRAEYVALNQSLQQVDHQLADLKNRDDRLYRSILSLDPLPASIRNAGTGGSERYGMMINVSEPQMVVNTFRKIDKISDMVQVQSSSLENVYAEAVENQKLLSSKPSIQPLSPADPFWLTSTYGYRTDPFTKVRSVHLGIDLSGPYGLEVYATGDGIVKIAGHNSYGYGNEVYLDHGFGYTSRYAHLQKILVKEGQEVKRGQLIGLLGSTGRSTGPHLHYEVRVDGHTMNPMYYFYENLTATEYGKLTARANLNNRTYRADALSQK